MLKETPSSLSMQGMMEADITISRSFEIDYGNFSGYENSSTNATNSNGTILIEWDDPIHMPLVRFVFISLYIIIFALGLFGNFLVCFVVARQRTMQTVTNFFISNLAIADIFLCLFCVPLTPTYSFLQKWIFGKFLCQFVAFLQCWCVYLSTVTLTSIAIDRFFVIIFPFRPRMKVTTCLMILVSIWIVAFCLTFPYGYYMTLEHIHDTIICDEDWPEDVRKIFGTVTSILQFFLPFCIILICYLCIFCKLQKNKKRLAKAKNSKKKNNSEKALKKKTSTNQMLVLMVSIFGLCWLPLNIINIVDDYYADFRNKEYFNFYFFISHLFAMSSVIYNPILYGLLNDNFKKEFKQIVPCLFVKISARRDLKNPKYFLSSLNNRNIRNDADETLIRNGDKTMAETTLIQPHNDNVMISIETDMNNVHRASNHHHNNENENGNNGYKDVQINDNNLMVIKGCDEITSEHSERTSSRTNETSIS